MTATYVQSTALVLGDDPADVQVRYADGIAGEYAVLGLGDRLAVHVSQTSPEVLRRLAAAASELADWREQQLAGVRQVAA